MDFTQVPLFHTANCTLDANTDIQEIIWHYHNQPCN